MLLVTELLKWWYVQGLRQRIQKIALQLDGTIDYFSMDLLLKTLFAPFHQISAGKVEGSLQVQFQAFIDKLFSRVIGLIVRCMLLLVGCAAIMLQLVASAVMLLLWLLAPLFILAGIISSIPGVGV